MNISKEYSDAINIRYVSATLVARLSFVPEWRSDKNASPRRSSEEQRETESKGGKETRVEPIEQRFVYSKSMEFCRCENFSTANGTVIDWKFCWGRIKFLSTWSIFVRFGDTMFRNSTAEVFVCLFHGRLHNPAE